MPQVVVLKDGKRRLTWRVSWLAVAGGLFVIAAALVALNVAWAGRQNSVVMQAKQLDGHHQYKSEEQVLNAYLEGKPPGGYQAGAWKQLGVAAYQAGDYRQAFNAYLRADTLGKPDAEVKVGVAEAATAIGDKSTAVSYYKQAMKLVPDGSNEQGTYQAQVRVLEDAQ